MTDLLTLELDRLGLLADTLLDCACEALAQTTCGCPNCSFVAVGTVAWDNCCDGGQLWVTVDRMFPYERFPSPATGAPVLCGTQLAADLVITVLRCAPQPDENGNAPSPEVIQVAALGIYEDMEAVMSGVLCCLSPTKKCRPFVITSHRPLGPAGGCQGSELRLTVALPDHPCPPV